MTTLLAFLFTLGLLIVVHEWGHYRAAVACGVKVLRFSVGFGRVLWMRRRGETEFVISMLPVGGYVKMLDEREGSVAPNELDRAFNRQPIWKRAVIVAAGPAANLVLAVALYAGANWVGMDEPRALIASPAPGSVAEAADLQAGDLVAAIADGDGGWDDVASISDLRWRLTRAALEGRDLRLRIVAGAAGRGADAGAAPVREVDLPLGRLQARDADASLSARIGITGPYREPVIAQVVAGGAADRAGLQAGDRVVRIDGSPVADAAGLIATIRASARDGDPRPQAWDILRDGRALSLSVQPAPADDRGLRIGRIEAVVGSQPAMVHVSSGFLDGIGRAISRTWEMSTLSLRMLGRMLVGEASVRNLSGPLTIADYAGQSVQAGLAYYLGFLAVVSVSLGVLNLLPLPMLDGGHLMYYLFEGVTGRPVSDLWLERLQRGGFVVILLMMSVALYNDVARLLGLH